MNISKLKKQAPQRIKSRSLPEVNQKIPKQPFRPHSLKRRSLKGVLDTN